MLLIKMERYMLQQGFIMSDEAHFNLGGYANKQNCRIWGSENSKMIFEKPLYFGAVFGQKASLGLIFFGNEA